MADLRSNYSWEFDVLNTKRKDYETRKQTCSKCNGAGVYKDDRYETDSYYYKGKNESYSSIESTAYGCDKCGGSGSFPATKAYTDSFFSGSAQAQYNRDFDKNIKKGSGRVIIKVETFPCSSCGKYHDDTETTSDGYLVGKTNQQFALSSKPLPCNGNTEIREVSRKPDSGWF